MERNTRSNESEETTIIVEEEPVHFEQEQVNTEEHGFKPAVESKKAKHVAQLSFQLSKQY